MAVQLKAGLIRVLTASGDTAGSGFVLTKGGLLVTCAHVVDIVNPAPGAPIRVVFQLTGEMGTARVVQEYLRPASGQDIAILRWDAQPSASITALPLGFSAGSYGHNFQTFGFPEAKSQDGLGAAGTIGNSTKEAGFPVVQLMNTPDVTAGFSGAPVLDMMSQRVVGMVSFITRPDEYGRLSQTAFMTPSESLRSVCNELQISDVCPYLGLEAFSEEHASLFYGRERVVTSLVERLRNDPSFLAILGPSGSGKSSLVKAGLIPRLRGRGGQPGKFGDIILTRPVEWDDLGSIQLPGAAEDFKGAVERRQRAQGDGKRLVLLIDQFEEIFVSVSSEKRAAIIAQILQLAGGPNSTVILTMRDEFYGRLSREASALLPWIERTLVNVPADIERGDLEAIVKMPATTLGLRFEDGLADRILDDAIDAASITGDSRETARSTVLPLLEFALAQLWEQRQDGLLTHQSYDQIGRVVGGVTQWANQAYDGLDEEAKPLARRLCVSLVHLGDESRGLPDTRTRRQIKELRDEDAESAAIDDVVRHLTAARILVTSRETQADIVEFVHDLLVRDWELLKSWLRADKQFLQWSQEIEGRAQAWADSSQVAGERDAGRLMPEGRDLAAAHDFLQARGSELKAIERDYIQASLTLREQERQRLEKLLEETQRQRNEAVKQRGITLSRQLAAEAEMLGGQESHLLQKGVLLAIESIRRAPSVQADHVLRQGMALLPWLKFGAVHGVPGGAVRMDPDGAYVQTANAGQDRNSLSGSIQISPEGKHVNGVSMSFSNDGRYLATTAGEDFLSFLAFNPDEKVPGVQLSAMVGEVVFSPGGKYFAVRNLGAGEAEPGMAWIYPTSGQPCVQLQTEKPISRMKFSPDDRFVATAGNDRCVRLWDTQGGRKVFEIASNESRGASSVAFTPDGKFLAYIDQAALIPNRIKFVEILSGRETKVFPQKAGAHTMAFSPDGKYLAAAGGASATIWDLNTNSPIAQVSHELRINAVAFSPDSLRLATVSLDKTACLWSVPSGALEARWIHEGTLWALAFSPNGRYLATAGEACLARVWDVGSKEEVARMVLDDNTNSANEIAFSPDGRLLAVASNQGAFWVFEATPRQKTVWIPHESPVTAVQFMPDGQHLATIDDQAMHFWNVATGKEEGKLVGQSAGVIFSPNGKLGAVSTVGKPPGAVASNSTLVWDLATGASVASLPTATSIRSLAFHPDSSLLATADHSATVTLWDIAKSTAAFRITVQGAAYAITFNLVTGQLVTASWQQERVSSGTLIQVWDSSGKEVSRQFCSLIAKALAVTPDGVSIFIAGYGGAQLWTVNSLGKDAAEPVAYFPLSGSVNGIAFTPDGRQIAMAGSDKSARIWDVATVQEVVRLDHEDVVDAVAFSPDGKYIATASEDESAAIWLWRPEDLIAEVKPRLTRNLTPSEWRQHLGADIPYECAQPGLPARDPALVPQQVIEPLIPQSLIMGRKRRKHALSVGA